MTDLTQDWKDGKLPAGWYYIKIADIVFIDFFEGKVWQNKKDEYIDEVLAPVPSYDEWQSSEKYNKHLEEKIKIYERKDKQATETSIAYNELLEENTKLKELLKECFEYIDWTDGTGSPISQQKLLDKIEPYNYNDIANNGNPKFDVKKYAQTALSAKFKKYLNGD